jgi:hypothetical protein
LKPTPAPATKVTDAPEKLITHHQELGMIQSLCFQLGMTRRGESPMDDILHFIRDLAQRAGEGYTISQVQDYIRACFMKPNMGTLYDAMQKINDPQDGIAAVTKRKDG